MFSDLRGFTRFSETQPVEQVIAVVNHYLNEMTEAILDAGGTLIAYMGDGIMAVFGAPLEQDDHADRAHARRARDDRPAAAGVSTPGSPSRVTPSGFRMGVGLNTGPVMCGNVGAEQRVEYTAIGDTTNTASRLEGMTKGTRAHAVRRRGDARCDVRAARGPGVRRGVRGARPRGQDAHLLDPRPPDRAAARGRALRPPAAATRESRISGNDLGRGVRGVLRQPPGRRLSAADRLAGDAQARRSGS